MAPVPRSKLIPVPLDRSMTTDGMEHEIAISETLNLVKPPGVRLHGYETRPGLGTFDSLATGVATAGKGRVHLCELDTADGYPPDTYLVLFQENVTGKILQMHYTEALGYTGDLNEPLTPPETMLPVAISDHNYSNAALMNTQIHSYDDPPYWPTATEGGAFPIIVIGYDTEANDFVYWVVVGFTQPSINTSMIRAFTGEIVISGDSSANNWKFPFQTYSWSALVAQGGTLNGVAGTPNFNSITYPIPGAASDLAPTGVLPQDFATEWIDSAHNYRNVGRATGNATEKLFERTPATNTDGTARNFTLTVPAGQGMNSTSYPNSRPDADGNIIVLYTTHANDFGRYYLYAAKVESSTGTVLATLLLLSGINSFDLPSSTVGVIPLSTGGYFLQIFDTATALSWKYLPSNLASATSISRPAAITALGIDSHIYPLVNMGGLAGEVYLYSSGSTSKLIKIAAVGTSPVVSILGNVTPGKMYTPDFSYVHRQHFRMPNNQMMLGMWAVIDLSDGSTVSSPTAADRYGMHNYVPQSVGSTAWLASSTTPINMVADPFRLLPG